MKNKNIIDFCTIENDLLTEQFNRSFDASYESYEDYRKSCVEKYRVKKDEGREFTWMFEILDSSVFNYRFRNRLNKFYASLIQDICHCGFKCLKVSSYKDEIDEISEKYSIDSVDLTTEKDLRKVNSPFKSSELKKLLTNVVKTLDERFSRK